MVRRFFFWRKRYEKPANSTVRETVKTVGRSGRNLKPPAEAGGNERLNIHWQRTRSNIATCFSYCHLLQLLPPASAGGKQPTYPANHFNGFLPNGSFSKGTK